MRKGGYKIIDLKDNSLSNDAVTIEGIYEAIEGSYRKPLLLSGVNIGGTEKPDVFVEANVSGSDYTIVAYGGTLTITDEDSVTYA